MVKHRAELAVQMKEMVVPSIAAVKRRKEFKQRKFEKRPKYEQSTWGMMLAHPRFKDPHDRKGGQLFRRRFRVPFPVYLEILRMTRVKATGFLKGETPLEFSQHLWR